MDQIRVKKIYITAEHQQKDEDDPEHDFTDVIVLLDNDRKYSASFFTYAFVEHMRNRNRLTGEFLGGMYFWEKNMVLVEECSREIISPVVEHIIEEGEFKEVFRLL